MTKTKKHAHIRTYTYIYTCTYTRTYTHVYIHTYIYTRTYTHTNTMTSHHIRQQPVHSESITAMRKRRTFIRSSSNLQTKPFHHTEHKHLYYRKL